MRRPSITPNVHADEDTMSIIEDMMWHVRTRMNSDPVYTGQVHVAALRLFHEIWPARASELPEDYIAAVIDDIDRISVDLLDDLSGKVATVSTRLQDSDPPLSAVASLLAGWLRCRSMELACDDPLRKAAYQLKIDHSVLFSRLLCKRIAVAS